MTRANPEMRASWAWDGPWRASVIQHRAGEKDRGYESVRSICKLADMMNSWLPVAPLGNETSGILGKPGWVDGVCPHAVPHLPSPTPEGPVVLVLTFPAFLHTLSMCVRP